MVLLSYASYLHKRRVGDAGYAGDGRDGAGLFNFGKSKSPGTKPELLDTVGSGLAPHSPRRAIRVSNGYPTSGFYPPNPPHFQYIIDGNKNNTFIAKDAVFGSPLKMWCHRLKLGMISIPPQKILSSAACEQLFEIK